MSILSDISRVLHNALNNLSRFFRKRWRYLLMALGVVGLALAIWWVIPWKSAPPPPPSSPPFTIYWPHGDSTIYPAPPTPPSNMLETRLNQLVDGTVGLQEVIDSCLAPKCTVVFVEGKGQPNSRGFGSGLTNDPRNQLGSIADLNRRIPQNQLLAVVVLDQARLDANQKATYLPLQLISKKEYEKSHP